MEIENQKNVFSTFTSFLINKFGSDNIEELGKNLGTNVLSFIEKNKNIELKTMDFLNFVLERFSNEDVIKLFIHQGLTFFVNFGSRVLIDFLVKNGFTLKQTGSIVTYDETYSRTYMHGEKCYSWQIGYEPAQKLMTYLLRNRFSHDEITTIMLNSNSLVNYEWIQKIVAILLKSKYDHEEIVTILKNHEIWNYAYRTITLIKLLLRSHFNKDQVINILSYPVLNVGIERFRVVGTHQILIFLLKHNVPKDVITHSLIRTGNESNVLENLNLNVQKNNVIKYRKVSHTMVYGKK